MKYSSIPKHSLINAYFYISKFSSKLLIPSMKTPFWIMYGKDVQNYRIYQNSSFQETKRHQIKTFKHLYYIYLRKFANFLACRNLQGMDEKSMDLAIVLQSKLVCMFWRWVLERICHQNFYKTVWVAYVEPNANIKGLVISSFPNISKKSSNQTIGSITNVQALIQLNQNYSMY